MDARHFTFCVMTFLVVLGPIESLSANNFRSRNFMVTAPDKELATQIGFAAEKYRKELALEWLGRELPAWRTPCMITAVLDQRAFGETTFSFSTPPGQKGMPFDFVMKVNGTRERLLDSVLPHEITHTVFATHFGQPLPRWADEGACTTVEHISERRKNHRMLIEFLTTNRGIPFNQMFAMKQYPRDILPLYAQGYSLCRFLIQQGGKQKFIGFVDDGLVAGNWDQAVFQHYRIKDLSQLQTQWLGWVKTGCKPLGSQQLESLVSTPVRSGNQNVLTQENPDGGPAKHNSAPQQRLGAVSSPRQGPGLDRSAAADLKTAAPNNAAQTNANSNKDSLLSGNFYLREMRRSSAQKVYR